MDGFGKVTLSRARWPAEQRQNSGRNAAETQQKRGRDVDDVIHFRGRGRGRPCVRPAIGLIYGGGGTRNVEEDVDKVGCEIRPGYAGNKKVDVGGRR